MQWLVGSLPFSRSRVVARKQRKDCEEGVAKILERNRVQKQEWERRIENARRWLTGADWKDPAGKEAFVKEVYMGKVPQYLWYAMGSMQAFGADTCQELGAMFWENTEGISFGDLEVHVSLLPGIGYGLRIRNPKRFQAEILIEGVKCPLYQTGYWAPWGGSGSEPLVNFIELYKQP